MAWECECRSQEMFAVCHHCGKPLCRAHGQVIVDDAFSFDPLNPLSERTAVHCQQCRDNFHPRAQDVEHQRAGVMGSASS
jgi:hypothetical protein